MDVSVLAQSVALIAQQLGAEVIESPTAQGFPRWTLEVTRGGQTHRFQLLFGTNPQWQIAETERSYTRRLPLDVHVAASKTPEVIAREIERRFLSKITRG